MPDHKTIGRDILRLVQFTERSGARRVAASDDGKTLRVLTGVARTYDLALAAARANTSLESAAKAKIGAETLSYDEVINEKRLLPPQRIEGQGFSIAARNFPAHMVAGDFYDVVKLDDGSVAVIVADVAGKGMGASLIMASVKAVLPFVGRGRYDW